MDDFRYSLRRNDLASALDILDKLFENKTKATALGPFVLGVLISRVFYNSSPLDKQKHFQYLWQ